VSFVSKQQQQKIVQYLNEAHASELALVRQLQAQIAMTPKGSFRDGLETHLQETRRHAERLEGRLGDLGQGNNPLQVGLGAVQSVIGQALALTKTPLDLVRGSDGEEKVLKNAKDSCAAEAQEIATYTALARLARTAGDGKTERLAKSLLRDEQRMLDRLLKEIPCLTDAVARSEFDGEGFYEVTETGAAETMREVSRTAKRTAHRSGGRAKRTGPARPARCRGSHVLRARSREPLLLSRTWRSRTTIRSARTRFKTSSPSFPRSTWRRSTPMSARIRTAPRLRAGSTRCEATSRGRDTTSSVWTKSAW
jgi:ferritin-like metal-binding protein YciE